MKVGLASAGRQRIFNFLQDQCAHEQQELSALIVCGLS